MSDEMSLWRLVADASLLVQLVMLLLLVASIFSWSIIIQKQRQLHAAFGDVKIFENRFWSGIDLVELYRQLHKRRDGLTGQASLFEAGFGEYARLRKQEGMSTMDIVTGAQRAMRVSLSRELDRLEAQLPILATIGSTSPYVGLFGTVWGIMNSFRALGGAQHATLAMVAPGIAEALIATAMGLFAAIPAVIAYNRFSSEVERLDNRYETFNEEFSTLLQRQAQAQAQAQE
jgi:biopolymer transport protein TolQ